MVMMIKVLSWFFVPIYLHLSSIQQREKEWNITEKPQVAVGCPLYRFLFIKKQRAGIFHGISIVLGHQTLSHADRIQIGEMNSGTGRIFFVHSFVSIQLMFVLINGVASK